MFLTGNEPTGYIYGISYDGRATLYGYAHSAPGGPEQINEHVAYECAHLGNASDCVALF